MIPLCALFVMEMRATDRHYPVHILATESDPLQNWMRFASACAKHACGELESLRFVTANADTLKTNCQHRWDVDANFLVYPPR